MKFREGLKSVVRCLVAVLFPYRAFGAENLPQTGAAVLCCNHQSMLDPVHLLVAGKRHIYFMAKAELFKNPILRWVLRDVMGAFAVDRAGSGKQSIDHAIKLVNDGHIMGIFPEGTRSKDGTLGRAKAGAAMVVARTGADVIPCCVIRKKGKLRLFSRTTVVYGERMTVTDLRLDGEKPDIRYAARLIMDRIAQLMEEER